MVFTTLVTSLPLIELINAMNAIPYSNAPPSIVFVFNPSLKDITVEQWACTALYFTTLVYYIWLDMNSPTLNMSLCFPNNNIFFDI